MIVDDFVLSGDFNSKLIEVLLSLGYKKENIKVCCLAVTRVVISSDKAPDLYWKVVDDKEFYFPWGKLNKITKVTKEKSYEGIY